VDATLALPVLVFLIAVALLFDFLNGLLRGETDLVLEIVQALIRSLVFFHQLSKFEVLLHQVVLDIRLEKIHASSGMVPCQGKFTFSTA
jgi:hypothetical protein